MVTRRTILAGLAGAQLPLAAFAQSFGLGDGLDELRRGVGGDPYFANVVLLLHLDGANNSTTITDNSPAGHGFSVSGGALNTAQSVFGSQSSWLSTITAYAWTPDSADWSFGSGPFTVEAWVRPTSAPSGVVAVVAQFGGATNLAWFLGFNGNTLNFFYSTTGTDNPVVTGAYTPTLNTWVHVAADRDASNVLRVYAGGVVIGSATAAVTFFDGTRTLRIGNDENNNRGFVGHIDEVRITKGIARYGGAFTPPSTLFPNQ